MRLAEYFELSVLGTGKLLRKEVDQQSALGLEIQGYLNRGELAPDVVIVDLVENWLLAHPKGWVLDGFPRTLAQAKAADKMIGVDPPQIVIFLEMTHSSVLSRVSSRRECVECRSVFSTTGANQKCPICGGLLQEFSDDSIEAMLNQYSNFSEYTAEVFDYYQDQNRVIRINGEQDSDSVFSDILNQLKEFQADGQTKEK